MLIRIRISMLIPIQIRIRIGINTMPVLMQILPQVLQCWKIWIFILFLVTTFPLSMLDLSHQCQMCHVFSILDSILKFSGKVYFFINLLTSLELIPTEIGRIRIRQNDACGSDPFPIQIHNTSLGFGESWWSPLILIAKDWNILGQLHLKRKNEVVSTGDSSEAPTSDVKLNEKSLTLLLFKRWIFVGGSCSVPLVDKSIV